MDNGVEVLAKLPNPNAGPPHFTTASEVATRKFLLEGSGIPVPRIYAWSSNRTNPVGAEYIIEEKAPGKPLGSLWYDWPRKSKLDIIAQVAEIETKLASTVFSQHGCIYFRDDLQGGPAANKPLTTDPPLPRSILDQLTLGPLTAAELWKDERGSMALDRGPWNCALDFTRAMGLNEIRWVKTHAKPRMNYHRLMDEPESPDELLELLTRYMEIARHLVPPSVDGEIHSKSLWHPDLHLDNVFVDPDSKKITRIVDWQSAAVAPLFFHCGVPRLFRHHRPVTNDWSVPERPANYDSLTDEAKRKADDDLESEVCHKYYRYQTYKKNRRHWMALASQDHISIRTKPTWLVSGVWQNQDVFFLRQSLIALAQRWKEIEPNAGSCPITFTERELELHANEDENISGVGELLKTLRDEAMLPADGMVDPADYDQARRICEKYRGIFLGLADSEAQRKLFAKIWPYQDVENG
ncbi:MAG: hypothetical protein M1817_002922 [Caeruleum heppii]|nr:MAG: hypothetical protein M1817_002922 [Caeruleum heppii]